MTRVKKRPLDAVLKVLEDIKADGLSSSHEITEDFIKGVMAKGFEYHVWTIDDVASARRFKGWGAASITTNVPGLIREGITVPKVKVREVQ